MHLELHVEYLVTYLGILYSNLSCWRGSFILVSILIFYIPFLYILKARYGATTHAVTTYWWHIVMVMRFACFTKKKKRKKWTEKYVEKTDPASGPRRPISLLRAGWRWRGVLLKCMIPTHEQKARKPAKLWWWLLHWGHSLLPRF